MQQQHRDAIQKNFSTLVEQTDLDLMVAVLYEKRVFSGPMIEPYKDTNKDTRTRKRLLYLDLMRRGPHAFRHLLDALSENGYWNIVRELDPDSALHIRPISNVTGENSYLSLSDHRRHNPTDPNRNRHSNSPPAAPAATATAAPDPNGNTTEATGGATGVTGAVGGVTGAARRAPGVVRGATGNADGRMPPPKINEVIKSTSFVEGDEEKELYRSRCGRDRERGVLLLFSYSQFEHTDSERLGALQDHSNLKELFAELGFETSGMIDLTLEETQQALDLQRSPGSLVCTARPECVFVVFASHGYRRGNTSDTEIRCRDGKLLSLYTIINYFSNKEFPALRGIPKVFIFQTCRGDKDYSITPPQHLVPPAPRRATRYTTVYTDGSPTVHNDDGFSTENTEDVFNDNTENFSTDNTEDFSTDHTVHTDGKVTYDAAPSGGEAEDRLFSDILIAHSTVPGYVSHRDPTEGSWYIQALCHVFAARAHDTHVKQLFSLVDDYMGKQFHAQTSSVDSWGFNKRLYLHPGMYEH